MLYIISKKQVKPPRVGANKGESMKFKFRKVCPPKDLTDLFTLYPSAVRYTDEGMGFIYFIEPIRPGEEFWGVVFMDGDVHGSNTFQGGRDFQVAFPV